MWNILTFCTSIIFASAYALPVMSIVVVFMSFTCLFMYICMDRTHNGIHIRIFDETMTNVFFRYSKHRFVHCSRSNCGCWFYGFLIYLLANFCLVFYFSIFIYLLILFFFFLFGNLNCGRFQYWYSFSWSAHIYFRFKYFRCLALNLLKCCCCVK